MSKRKVKTIEIADLRDRANKVFRDSGDEFKTGRASIKLFVEDILMQTGNYKGFNYLAESEVEPGKTFGIAFKGNEPTFYDQTRVKFY